MPYIGEFAAVSAAVLWSFGSFVFTNVSFKIGTLQLNVWRLVSASILLSATIFLFQINFHFTLYQFIFLTLSGILGLVLGDSFLFKAFTEIGPRVSMLVMSSNPAIAATMAFFLLNESLSIYSVLGMFLTILGIYIVISNQSLGSQSRFKLNTKGIFYAFMGAVGQSSGLIFAKVAMLQSPIDGLVATLIRIVTSTFLLVIIGIFSKKLKSPLILFKNNYKLIGLIVLGSILGPYLGITSSYIAIMHTKVGIASTLMALVPIIMLPLSVVIYKEKLQLSSIIGALIAFGGVALLFIRF